MMIVIFGFRISHKIQLLAPSQAEGINSDLMLYGTYLRCHNVCQITSFDSILPITVQQSERITPMNHRHFFFAYIHALLPTSFTFIYNQVLCKPHPPQAHICHTGYPVLILRIASSQLSTLVHHPHFQVECL